MIISDLFTGILPSYFGYVDEIVALFVLIVLILGYPEKLFKNLVFVIISILVLIGILGNIVFRLRSEFLLVALDVFFFIKPFLLMLYIMISHYSCSLEKLLPFIERISKVLLCMLSVLSLFSVFYPTGMIDGMGNFALFSAYSGVIGFWASLLISYLYVANSTKFIIYYFMSFITVLRSGSDFAFLLIVILLCAYFFLNNRKKFHWYYIPPLILIGIYIGRNEIVNYLLSESAPRSILLRFGFKTANCYFPLGSGFGTFGTKIAAENYSSLYTAYGFNNIWGMSANDMRFLLDSYYPQIIGQLGYLGMLVFCCMILYIAKKYILTINNVEKKFGLLFILGAWLVCGLGFNNSNSWSCLALALIALISRANNRDEL